MHMSAPPSPAPGYSAHLSLTKQQQVFDSVFEHGFDVLVPPVKVTEDMLRLAHKAGHVARILEGTFHNGHANYDKAVLEHAKESVGSHVAATIAALTHGVAFSPTNGFHHAGYDNVGGFCTFNGLIIGAVVALELLEYDHTKSVVILDGDAHHGDGTEDIISQRGLEAVLNFNMRDLKTGALRNLIDGAGLVMYQAGADAHKEDPFGAGYLSTQELKERDAEVFTLCKQLGVPVVFNLAGGYSKKHAINLHIGTVLTAKDVFYPGWAAEVRKG